MGVGTAVAEALKSLRRNGLMSAASVATVAVSLFILSVFLLAALNLDNLARTIESQLEVRLYLAEGLDEAALEDLRSQLLALPGVTEVLFVSKEQALNDLKEQLGDRYSHLLEGVEEMNPLRHSFRVFTLGPAWVDPVAAAAAELDGVENVGYTHDLVQRLLRLTNALRLGGLALVGLMVLATVLVISNTVRLTILARGEEIYIMRLVGATAWFIRWPFLLEGMFLGVAGALVAGVVAWQGYSWAVGWVYRSIPFMPVVPVYPLAWRLGLVLVAAGGVVGALGSLLSLRRFLRA